MDVKEVTTKIKIANSLPILEFLENDQTAPAGMWRVNIDDDALAFDRALAADWSSSENWLTLDKATETITFNKVVSLTGATALLDDTLFTLGDDSDQVMLNRSTTLNANTALASVLIGTPVSPALAANSLIISNITSDGDILIAVNDGGTSKGLIHIDGSLGEIHIHSADGLNMGNGSDVDQDLITVDVTGTPKLSWDETNDRFAVSKPIAVADVVFSNEWRLTEDNQFGVILISPENKKYRMVAV